MRLRRRGRSRGDGLKQPTTAAEWRRMGGTVEPTLSGHLPSYSGKNCQFVEHFAAWPQPAESCCVPIWAIPVEDRFAGREGGWHNEGRGGKGHPSIHASI